MKHASLRWGILGTASIGRRKAIPATQQSSLNNVVAIASRDSQRAREAAAALGIPTVHDCYEALLADPQVDAIYNPLPNHLHLPWTVKALQAGKHVLCEKPIALNAQQAEEIAAAERSSGRRVAEAFMVRHHPQWLRTRALAADGAIGPVQAMSVLFTYRNADPANIRNRRETGGGALYDVGCYAIAAGRFIFGSEPVRVIAGFSRDPVLETDRLTSGVVEFPGGRYLNFTVGTQTAARQRVELLGGQGRIEIPVPFNPDPLLPSHIVIDDGRDLYGGGARIESFAACDQFTLQVDAFAAAIAQNRPFAHPIADAVANMKVLDALMRSEGSGRWETVA